MCGLDKGSQSERNVIIDLCGGMFDISSLTIDDSVFDIQARSSDTHLGAENFDSRVVMHRIDKFKWKYKKDIHVNGLAVIRLDAREPAKRNLLSSANASIEVDQQYDHDD